MGRLPLIELFKCLLTKFSFKLFLWSVGMSDKDYWKSIYLQEKQIIERSGR